MKLFESLEDESLLSMVDEYCSQPVHNPFEIGNKNSMLRLSKKSNHMKSGSKLLVLERPLICELLKYLLQMIIDKLIDLYPGSVAPQSVPILDALIYKMSAPYRHAKFWRFTRRVSKELNKLNALNLKKYLKNIAKDMVKSEMRYSLNVCAKRYIAAMLICRAIRNCRLRRLCEQAASHCLQHIQTGHLLQSNLLLLALNADVYDSTKKIWPK
ncbi:BMA-SPTL-1, isoform c [Dirofilaria immitis]|nr:BMA-SPTL-1, isoform c [Dirofilaria immitis]